MRQLNRLNAAKVKSLVKQPGRHRDGGGLILEVKPAKIKGPDGKLVEGDGLHAAWLLRFDLDRVQRWMGLGSAQVVSLGEARAERDKARKLIAAGIDPIEARKAERAAARAAALCRRTFREVSEELVESHSKGWRTKHANQVRNSIATYCRPIMQLDVATIGVPEVLACIQPDWMRAPITMERVRARIEDVLGFAQVKGIRPPGPLPTLWKDHLEKVLPAPRSIKPIEHHPSLPYTKAPELFAKLTVPDASVQDLCLAYTMLTAGRSVEQREAQRSEFNGNRLWSVPSSRMKKKRMHNVPLSDAALAIIERLPQTTENLFTVNGNAKPIVAQTLRNSLKRHAGPGFTVHGLRATFRSWADEQTDAEWDIKEIAIAHTIGSKTQEAYSRSDLIEKRRGLMQAWADYLAGKIGLTNPPDEAALKRAVGDD